MITFFISIMVAGSRKVFDGKGAKNLIVQINSLDYLSQVFQQARFYQPGESMISNFVSHHFD